MLKWFSNLNIGRKIILGYGVVIGIIITGIGTGHSIATFYQDRANVLIEDALDELLLLNYLENHLLLTQNYYFILFQPLNASRLEPITSQQVLDEINAFKKYWSEFFAEHGELDVFAPGESFDEKEATDKLVKTYQDLAPLLTELKENIISQKPPTFIPTTREDQNNLSQTNKYNNELEIINQFLDDISELKKLVIIEYQEAKAVSQQADIWKRNIIFISGFLSIIIAVILGSFIARSIVKPLQEVIKVSQDVTQSNHFDRRVPVITNNEVGRLAESFNQLIGQVNNLLKSQQEANKNLEQQVAIRTEELSNALLELQTVQAEIIQSEKMAALGNLVAGIAHEINTPLGAIQASIGNISSNLQESLKTFPKLFQKLSPQELNQFCLLLTWATESQEILSSREERQLRRKLKNILMENQIDSPERLADLLSRMNITESLDPIFPLLKNKSALFFMNCAYQIVSINNNSKNISIATERAAKIVFALKSYIHQNDTDTPKKIKLSESLDLILILYQNQLKKGIRVTKNYEKIPLISCYPEEITQVWSNLIGNAIQAMNYQGELKIEIKKQDDYVVVTIEDSGSGIPQEIQNKIFEPFFTTKARGEGSGLGLHIVRQIIDKHEGKIELFSKIGYNTVFKVFLPLT